MNHRSSNSGVAVVAILGYLVLTAIAAVVIAPKVTNRIVSAAMNKPVVAVEAVDKKKDETVHAAAVEVDKAVKAAAELPPSTAGELTKRFIGNAHASLNEVSPLSVTEDRNNTAILLGLLAEEKAARVAAEKGLQLSQADLAQAQAAKAIAAAKQQAVEKGLADTSNQLAAAQKAKETTTIALQTTEDKLQKSYSEVAAKLTEIETTKAHRIALAVLIVILGGVIWYFKKALNGAGASLHALESATTPDVFHQVVGTLDAALEKAGPLVAVIGQKFISEGKAAGAAIESKIKSIEAGSAALAKNTPLTANNSSVASQAVTALTSNP
jgi:hypothetical protein